MTEKFTIIKTISFSAGQQWNLTPTSLFGSSFWELLQDTKKQIKTKNTFGWNVILLLFFFFKEYDNVTSPSKTGLDSICTDSLVVWLDDCRESMPGGIESKLHCRKSRLRHFLIDLTAFSRRVTDHSHNSLRDSNIWAENLSSILYRGEIKPRKGPTVKETRASDREKNVNFILNVSDGKWRATSEKNKYPINLNYPQKHRRLTHLQDKTKLKATWNPKTRFPSPYYKTSPINKPKLVAFNDTTADRILTSIDPFHSPCEPIAAVRASKWGACLVAPPSLSFPASSLELQTWSRLTWSCGSISFSLISW